MIKIAVIDDEPLDRTRLCTCFQKLGAELQYELLLQQFASGKQFLSQFDCSFDLICLDIDMPDMDGIETAAAIRKLDPRVALIFVTNLAQMAIRGYQVRALDFLLKPVDYSSFVLKLADVLQIVKKANIRSILLETTEGPKKLFTDQLRYVEVNGHYLSYHTESGVFRQKAALRDLEKKLETLPFRRCNQCYLVNLEYVTAVDRDEICVGKDRLKVSRSKRKAFLDALINYLGGTGV